MHILGKLIPVRLLKWFDGDRKPKNPNTIATLLSTVLTIVAASLSRDHMMVNKQSDLPCRGDSFMQNANTIMREGLNVLSPIAGGVPMAGTPLKAAIDALLVVLNSINTRGRNRNDVARLTQRLSLLALAISAVPPATPDAQSQRDELARKLDAILDRLKRLHTDSVFGSSDIAQGILDCMREIDEHERDYTLLSVMQMQYTQQGILGRLPMSVQQQTVFVRDATGREYKLLADQCRSRKQLIATLECYFGETDRDGVLRDFITREAYDLYIEGEIGTTRLVGWSGVQPGTRIVMSAVFNQSRRNDKYKCPRPQCGGWNDRRDANDGWMECNGCPGRFQITNAEKGIGERTAKEGQVARESTALEAGGYRLDLIQIFHLRQTVGEVNL